MTYQKKICPHCGFTENEYIAHFCGNCQAKFQYQQTQTYMTRPHQQQSMLSPHSRNVSQGAFNAMQSVANDLEFFRQQLFQAKDQLKQGGIWWRFWGRGAYGRELSKRIDEMFAQIEVLWQKVYLRYHQQQAVHLLKRQQQQYDQNYQYADFLFEQQLLDEAEMRSFRRHASVIDLIIRLYIEEGRLDRYDEEVRDEILLRYNRIAEHLSFGLTDDDADDSNSLDYLEEDYQ